MPATFQVSEVTANKATEYNYTPFKYEYLMQTPWARYSELENNKKLLIQSSFNTNDEEKDNNLMRFKGNSFVMSAVNAYCHHHNLVIRPDDVWLAICIQFSFYVNALSDELRDKFVTFQEKRQLTVSFKEFDDLQLKMADEIAKNIKDESVRDWIMPQFTTTTQVDRIAGAAVLMGSMKKYFLYRGVLECSLPNVTLLGEVEDWINIRERANRLLEFDTNKGYMKEWSKLLFPVLDQFVESIKGNPDTTWWNRLADFECGGSGPDFLSGWITTFCVFTEVGEWVGFEPGEWPFVLMSNVPKGYVSVPIEIVEFGESYNVELFAGHMACEILSDEVTVQPRVDWAIFKQSSTQSEEDTE